MRDVEVSSIARHEGNLIGSDGEGVFLVASARVGEPAMHGPHHLQGRTIQPGDHLNLLIENNSDQGYYAEISRNVVFGRASTELLEGFEIAKAAQEHTLRRLRPGASCAEIYAAHSEFLKAHHLPPETRLYCHGQGYDLVERPLVRDDETMPLERDMFLACHPPYISPRAIAVICDNYFIEAAGVSECLHQTPKQVFEL
jgi:Xaa-Pro aminopeptidase